jgi:hypothetical protein
MLNGKTNGFGCRKFEKHLWSSACGPIRNVGFSWNIALCIRTGKTLNSACLPCTMNSFKNGPWQLQPPEKSMGDTVRPCPCIFCCWKQNDSENHLSIWTSPLSHVWFVSFIVDILMIWYFTYIRTNDHVSNVYCAFEFCIDIPLDIPIFAN